MDKVPVFGYPYDVVQVWWLDASTDHGWKDKGGSLSKVPLICTIGFLTGNTEEVVQVSSTVDSESDTNCRMNIPRGMVKGPIKVLKKQSAKFKEKK